MLKNLFGKGDAMDAAKGIGRFMDEQQFTLEEKAEHNKELIAVQVVMLKALEPFKLAQRYLGLATGFIMVFGALNLFIAAWVDVIWDKGAVDLFIKIIQEPFIYFPVSAFVTLYTCGGTINSMRAKQ